MSMDLYYFSATGNSLMVSKELQKRSKDCSIEAIAKIADKEKISPDSNVVGFVFPLYFSGMPNKVASFISKFNFSSVDYIFVVATKSQSYCPGVISEQINQILHSHNKTVNSVFYLDMIGNYIKKYDVLDLDKQKAANAKVIKKIDRISEIVGKKENVIENPAPLFNFIARRMYNAWKKNLPLSDSEFVSNNCSSCGLCVRICPNNNISLDTGKPTWHHNCESCLACIHVCPLKGIQYGKNTHNRGRYRNPQISVEELLLR